MISSYIPEAGAVSRAYLPGHEREAEGLGLRFVARHKVPVPMVEFAVPSAEGTKCHLILESPNGGIKLVNINSPNTTEALRVVQSALGIKLIDDPQE